MPPKVYIPTSYSLSSSLSYSFPPLSHYFLVPHFSLIHPWSIPTYYLHPLISLPSFINPSNYSAPFIPHLSSFLCILFPYIICLFLVPHPSNMLVHGRYSAKAFPTNCLLCPLPDRTRAPLLLDLRSSLRPSDHDRDLGRRRKRRLRRRETWPKHALDTAASSAGLMAGAAICARLCPWHSLALAARGCVALRWGLPVCPAHPPSQGCVWLLEARLGPITFPTRPLSPLSHCVILLLSLSACPQFSHAVQSLHWCSAHTSSSLQPS